MTRTVETLGLRTVIGTGSRTVAFYQRYNAGDSYNVAHLYFWQLFSCNLKVSGFSHNEAS